MAGPGSFGVRDRTGGRRRGRGTAAGARTGQRDGPGAVRGGGRAAARAGRRPGAGGGAHRRRAGVLGRRGPAPQPGRRRGVRRAVPARAGRAVQRGVQLPKPVVAAVNGHAIAGGCVLAAADSRSWPRATGGSACRSWRWACRSRGSRWRCCGTRSATVAAAGWCWAPTPTCRPPPGRSGWSTRWCRPGELLARAVDAAAALAADVPAGQLRAHQGAAAPDARERIERFPTRRSRGPAVEPAGHRRLDRGLPQVGHRQVTVTG